MNIDQFETECLADQVLLERAILHIHEHQTIAEKQMRVTAEQNGQGWNWFDAQFGTSLALRLQGGRSLTPGQIPPAIKMMRKYVGQLIRTGFSFDSKSVTKDSIKADIMTALESREDKVGKLLDVVKKYNNVKVEWDG